MGKDILDIKKQGHEVKHLMSVGGGTRNEPWHKIKASITERRLSFQRSRRRD